MAVILDKEISKTVEILVPIPLSVTVTEYRQYDNWQGGNEIMHRVNIEFNDVFDSESTYATKKMIATKIINACKQFIPEIKELSEKQTLQIEPENFTSNRLLPNEIRIVTPAVK